MENISGKKDKKSMTTKVSIVKETLNEYLETTTAHGFFRLANKNPKFVCVIWLLAIMGCTTFLLWQLRGMLIKFISHPKHQLSDSEDKDLNFPSVTVCNNLQAQAAILAMEKRLKTAHSKNQQRLEWEAHHHFLEEFFNGYLFKNYSNIPELEKYDKDDNLFEALMSRELSFANMNMKDVLSYTQDTSDFIMAGKIGPKQCDASHFTEANLPGHRIKCHTLRADQYPVERVGPAGGLSLVLYVDYESVAELVRGNDRGLLAMEVASRTSSVAGARLYIGHGEFPNVEGAGFDLPVGFSSSVVLKARKDIRLDQPWGHCSSISQFRIEDSLGNIRSYQYSEDLCRKLCKHWELIRMCGCRSTALPTEPKMTLHPFCGQLDEKRIRTSPRYRVSFTEKVLCELAELQRGQQTTNTSCRYACFPACEERSFYKTISSAQWPQDKHQPFFSQYFVDKINLQSLAKTGREMDAYRRLLKPITGNVSMSSGKIKHPRETFQAMVRVMEHLKHDPTLFTRNFLRVNVYFETTRVEVHEQKPSYEVMDLISGIGGTAGLSLGISFISLLELLWYFLLTCWRLAQKQRVSGSNRLIAVKPAKTENKNST